VVSGLALIRSKNLKKSLLFCAGIIACIAGGSLLAPSIAHAGDLNAAEQSVMNFAHGTFEYEGKTYRATDAAIAIAYAKLVQDGIDLTQEEADNYISQAKNNVKAGIDQGYLYLVGESENNDESGDDVNSDAQNGKNGKGNKKGENKGGNKGADSEESTTEEATTKELKYKDELEKVEKDGQILETVADETVVTRDDYILFKGEKVIKNTGHDISAGIWSMGTIAMVFSVSFVGAIVAKKDE
jgi:hypothetical protein